MLIVMVVHLQVNSNVAHSNGEGNGGGIYIYAGGQLTMTSSKVSSHCGFEFYFYRVRSF